VGPILVLLLTALTSDLDPFIKLIFILVVYSGVLPTASFQAMNKGPRPFTMYGWGRQSTIYGPENPLNPLVV
jgi:hypothetical protein